MLHLFVGTDDYLKSEGAKRVIDALVPPADRDFGLEIVDGACERADDALAARAKQLGLWVLGAKENVFEAAKTVAKLCNV